MLRATANQNLPKIRKILPLLYDSMNFPAPSSEKPGAKHTSLDGPLVWLAVAVIIFLWAYASVENYCLYD